MIGCASSGYAHALAETGAPRHLPQCDGWLLERAIPGTEGWRDAMGPYPMFACRDWSRLAMDLAELSDLVSVVVVTDPFAGSAENDLRASSDHVVEFKSDTLVEFEAGWSRPVSKHHRDEVRRALRSVEVERVDDPLAYLDDWDALYATLVTRHGLTGLHRFSRRSFAAQLAVPGIAMFVAREGGTIVGAHLWYVDGESAYNHLAACSARGYEVGATCALWWTALHALDHEVAHADIGGGAGLRAGTTGLDRFRHGWSDGRSAPVHLCGRTLDDERYATLAGVDRSTRLYPAYRAGQVVERERLGTPSAGS